jgi:hypothetical protein
MLLPRLGQQFAVPVAKLANPKTLPTSIKMKTQIRTVIFAGNLATIGNHFFGKSYNCTLI